VDARGDRGMEPSKRMIFWECVIYYMGRKAGSQPRYSLPGKEDGSPPDMIEICKSDHTGMTRFYRANLLGSDASRPDEVAHYIPEVFAYKTQKRGCDPEYHKTHA
jgi:hypothetical protein